ncbi:MAG: ABC transporter permease [Gordonia sp. (in: high G+C Gram-positive bacteria)]|uniref:ABC transporter permease n=1 Tax=Gordonia sp. (in: high G+C Gram-positive bacteria) TaxID=84139 RepID=UPI0039E4E849
MDGLADSAVRIGPLLAVALVLLAAIAVGVNHVGRTGQAVDTAVAVVRAVVQLAGLAVVLVLVFQALWASAMFVACMALVAAWTSAGRIDRGRGSLRTTTRCLLPVAAATLTVVTVLVLIGVLPAHGTAVVPTAGILLGGAMNTTSLAGRHAHEALRERAGEVEAALSLGLAERDAREMVVRPAAASALIPALDQTKSVGLVTIPGAFVGMVLGGAGVVDAAIMQLFVLIALLAVSSVALVTTGELVSRGLL